MSEQPLSDYVFRITIDRSSEKQRQELVQHVIQEWGQDPILHQVFVPHDIPDEKTTKFYFAGYLPSMSWETFRDWVKAYSDLYYIIRLYAIRKRFRVVYGIDEPLNNFRHRANALWGVPEFLHTVLPGY
jgi:hypothetical protein